MNRRIVLLSALAVVISLLIVGLTSKPNPVRADDKSPVSATIVPVDTSMHDFMEGMFQGPYRRLKPALAAEAADRQGWKAIRSESLILAEGGNLLLVRKPEKDTDKWVEFSVAVRESGAQLYQAAKQKDFAGSRKAYESMLTHCNACHTHFDKGKNQLAP
jgi:cytochrome c553